MNFTKEDIEKIARGLLDYSKKDSALDTAQTPLSGDEFITVVQDGVNKKLAISNIVTQFFLLGVSDFLNVSNTYGSLYITLQAAINLIPVRSRKIGQVIAFLDINENWQMYQFRGTSTSQWNTISLWKNFASLLVTSSLEPDGEDLTKSNPDSSGISVLKFKDKDYNALSHSGLGRIYLRKNIQNVNDYLTGNPVSLNVLSQDMIVKENTIYIIQYDFDLNGVPLTIPVGSTLKFEGGSISRGNVTCNNTILDGILTRNTCIFLGSYKMISCHPDNEDISFTPSKGLKFADKEYSPVYGYTGKGRIYLRKNIELGVEGIFKVTFSTLPTVSGPISINGTSYNVKAPVREVVTLTVTAGASTDGTITLNLGGTVTQLVVTASAQSTPELLATAIAGVSTGGFTTAFTVSRDGAVLTFTAVETGVKDTPSYTPGTTGATATLVKTTAGDVATSLSEMASIWTNGGPGNSQMVSGYTASVTGNGEVTFTANNLTLGVPSFICNMGTTGVTVTVEDISLNIATNVLTSEMFTQPNTRYIVQYDYNLLGQDIQVPSECCIVFEGGSIYNGRIAATDTLSVFPQPILSSQLPILTTGKYRKGQLVLNEDTENTLQFYDGTNWKQITATTV